MKKIILLLCLIASATISINAQDVIFFTSQDSILTRIVSRGSNNVSFKRWNNLSGPIETVATQNLFAIRYQDGTYYTLQRPNEEEKINISITEEKEWKVKGFEPQIRLSFDEGLDHQKNFSFGADFVAAYRFNEIIRLGAGIGINYVNLKFEDSKYIGLIKYDDYFEAAMSIPIFANVKVDFLKTKASPYLAIDCGYNIFVPFSKYAKDNKLGFFIRPALGVDIRFKKCVLFLDIAYKYQARDIENILASYKGYHQICQTIGVSF